MNPEQQTAEYVKQHLIEGDIYCSVAPYLDIEADSALLNEVLFPKAREARTKAISYRQFLVGAALAASHENGTDGLITTGANIKPVKDGEINLHAERIALDKISSAVGITAVRFVVVVGDIQPDQQSGKTLNTLHPCGECREMLESSPLLDDQSTIIATASTDMKTVELATLPDLLHFHKNAALPIEHSGIITLQSRTKVSATQLTDGLAQLYFPATT